MAEDLLEDMDGEELGESLDDDGAPAEKKGLIKRLLGNKKKMIIIILALVLVAGIAAGVWFFFFSSSDEDPEVLAQAELEAQQTAMETAIVFEDIVDLEPFERIPMKEGATLKFISLTVALELVEHNYRKQVYTLRDRLSRIVEARVRDMSWLELRSPEGKIRLKYEILSQMNRIFPTVTIRNIYFTNFLMQ